MRTYRNKKKWTRQGKKIFTRRRTFFFQTLLYQEKKDCDIPDSCLFVFSIPGVLVKLLLCSESAGSATVPFYPNFQAREQPRDQPGCYCLNRTTTAVLQKSTKCFLKKTALFELRSVRKDHPKPFKSYAIQLKNKLHKSHFFLYRWPLRTCWCTASKSCMLCLLLNPSGSGTVN